MKKIIVFTMTIIMLSCMSLTVFAAGNSTEIEVKAKYEYTMDDTTYAASTSDGTAMVTTKDGIVITVTGDFADGLVLVVKQTVPSDVDAYRWFSNVLDGKATNLCPFDIFFMKNGERVEPNTEMKIAITMPMGYKAPQMYYVDHAGKATLLDSTVSSGKISFRTDHNSFYVLGNKIATSGDHSQPAGNGQTGNNPKTGGSTPIAPYALLIMGSLGVITVITKKRKLETTGK